MFPKNLTYSVDTYVMSKAPERIGIWGLFLTTFWFGIYVPVLALYSITIKGGGRAIYVHSIRLVPTKIFWTFRRPCMSFQNK